MPWLLLVLSAGAGVVFGGAFGFVRGLGYPPTLVFAVFEGGILFGVPAALVGLLLVAAWYATGAVRRDRGR